MAILTFSERVYDVVRRIPCGSVMTYAQVARLAGAPGAARAVGNALNKNPELVAMPCHRVVRSQGQVGGYVHGTADKIRLLTAEGITINHDRIDLSVYLYEPAL